MARKNLYINNVNIGTYGIYISSDTYLNSPLIDYSSYNIPAKMGSVLKYNDRFNNVTRKFSCYIPQNTNISTALNQLKSLLYSSPGYVKIYSDYESSFYQMGYLAQDIQVKPVKDKTAAFDLYFSCKPQKYYKTNTQKTTNGHTVTGGVYLLPRRYTFIKNILVNVPLEIVPNHSAFVLYMPTAYTTGTYSSVTTNMPVVGYSNNTKFICAFKYTYGNGEEWDTYQMTGFLGATDQGTLNLTNISMNAEAIGFLMPAEIICDLDVTIDGTTYSETFTNAGYLDNSSTVLGLDALYTFKTYPNPAGTNAQNPTIYIRGLSDTPNNLGKTVWDGCVEINHHYLQNVYGDSQMRYCWFSIDSETMEAKLKYGTQALGYNTVNASDRISVDGRLSGTAKYIEVYMYGYHDTQYDTGYIEEYTIDPRWWIV